MCGAVDFVIEIEIEIEIEFFLQVLRVVQLGKEWRRARDLLSVVTRLPVFLSGAVSSACRSVRELCLVGPVERVETSFRVAFLLLLFGLLAVALLSVTASTCTCFGACLLLSDLSTDLVSSA